MGEVKGNSRHGRSADLMRKLRYELDFDAAEELVKLFRSRKATFRDKVKIADGIMQYQYPKLKAMELAAKQGEAVVFNIDLSGAANTKQEKKDAEKVED